jgi:exodeoxyribonuclease VII large subunit
LRTQLEAQGLFDDARKRPLPRFPRKIGVVTSESGAAFHDICQVLGRRWPLAEVVLSPTPVQGPHAAAGIVGAIQQLNRRGDIDVIIAGRGGGSIEELWAFNMEPVARTIFASAVPVVSAVGHETDMTIADFVADRRAPTPSAAAEIVAPDRVDVLVRLGVAAGVMASVLQQQVRVERESVASARGRMERQLPDVHTMRQRIDDNGRRGLQAAEVAHRAMVSAVGGCVWRLRALDPFATLERGYAIVQRPGAGPRVVSSVRDVRDGEALDVRVKDGSFGVHAGNGARPAPRKMKRRVAEAQAPLFTMPEERA